MAHSRSLVLPASLYTRADVSRLVREVEDLIASEHGDKLRSGEASLQMSRLLQNVSDANVGDDGPPTLQSLKQALTSVHQKAPVVHLSFAANPSPEFLERVISWFRTEVNPYVLLQIGLQPSIAAGCIIRTPSKYFDLTMRKRFSEKRPVLVEQLRGSREQA
ncbi:hypothetical protein KA047_01335 [Candidatus Saccharibacteria bacterium]|nr:hypothetical protein [Candidatus Saccharibacteria bacterium]